MSGLSHGGVGDLAAPNTADSSQRARGASPSSASWTGDMDRRLEEARRACSDHDIPAATRMCHALLGEMSELSEAHLVRRGMEIAELQAHLSYLSGDYVSATVYWTQLARRLHANYGTHSSRTRHAAGNAMAAWMRIDDGDRVRHLPSVLSMLHTVVSAAQTARARRALVACLAK